MCEDNEWDEQNIYIYVRACCCAASDAVSRMLQGIWHTTNTPCQKKNVVRNGAEFQAGQQFEGQPVCTINTNIPGTFFPQVFFRSSFLQPVLQPRLSLQTFWT